MDRHQQALGKLICDLVELDPVCSVIAIGSIGRGDYRLESDMDINVVTWRCQDIPKKVSWERSQELVNWGDVRLDEGYVSGIKTHLNCSTPDNYQALIMHAPVWRWGGSRILHDPSGIAKWGEACIVQFFADNPGIARRCREFHEDYLRHKHNQSLPVRFATQGEFVNSLDLTNVVIRYSGFPSTLREATRDSASQG